MIKYAGVENSGVRDALSGRPITITVSVRKAIRGSDPRWSKVRNAVLNTAIANDFSRGNPQPKAFKVKGSGLSGFGHVRESGGGAYVAIISKTEARIISVSKKSGTPKITSVQPPHPEGSFPIDLDATASYSDFFIKHSLGDSFGDADTSTLVSDLCNLTGLSPAEVIAQLKEHSDGSEIVDIVNNMDYVQPGNFKATVYDPSYEPTGANAGSGFAMQAPLFQP